MKRALCVFAWLSLAALPAFATGHPYTELEIPVPDLVGTNARALGMGGAHIAVAEDASAILWNPAGLASVRRIEVSATLARGDREVETTWHGSSSAWGTLDNQLGGLHFVYPLPTYRGSLVVGVGVDRLADYTLRYRRSGIDSDVPFFGGGPGLLADSHLRDGKLSGYSAAVGWDAGPRLSFGGSLTYLRGSIYDEQTFWTGDRSDVDTTYLSIEDFYILDANISGITGSAGFLYRATPRVRFGGVLGAPKWIRMERFEQLRTRDRFDDGSESIVTEPIPTYDDEEITFPFWLGFGVSVAAPGVNLAADLRHTDWRDIDDQVGSHEFFLRPYYRDGTSFALGAEVPLPWAPLRLRGGYRYDPAPFHLTYCPLAECEGEGRDPREIDIAIDRERQYVTLGAGYLFGGVLVVDFVYQTGSFERVTRDESAAPYSEERSAHDYILTVGYRF